MCCEARIERERERDIFINGAKKNPFVFSPIYLTRVIISRYARGDAGNRFSLCTFPSMLQTESSFPSWAWKDQSTSRAHDILIFPCSIACPPCKSYCWCVRLLLLLFFAIQYSSKQFFSRIIFRKLRKIIFNLNRNFQFQLFSSKMISLRISSMPINFVIY